MGKRIIFIFIFFLTLMRPAAASTIQLTSNVTDTVAPVINSYFLLKSVFQPPESVNLTVNVSDTSEISTVWATLRYPNTSSANFTASLLSGNNQSGNFSIVFDSTNALGSYTVTHIFANDTSSNMNVSLPNLTFSVQLKEGSTSSRISGIISTEMEEKEEEVKCIEKWVCSEWSECIDSKQTRSCSDLHSCRNLESKPMESRDCEVPITPVPGMPQVSPPLPSTQVPLGVWIFSALPLAFLAGLIYFRRKRRKIFKKIKRSDKK
ncbi:MAG: hypothetical protein ACE5J7_04965 [Candidatus Aenigmatarchaeota archaeon]